MDSKIVNKAIKQHIIPVLKENGFKVITQRSAWRYNTTRIDVINFQSFNSYLAESVGCTTFSFAVNLGIYFLGIPIEFPGYSIKERSGYPGLVTPVPKNTNVIFVIDYLISLGKESLNIRIFGLLILTVPI